MSLQIIIFIVIGYYFRSPSIFLISIFNRQCRNSLIYTSVPFFPHKSLLFKFNSHFEFFLFFQHFSHFYLKNLIANYFFEFQRSISLPLLQVSNLQFSYFVCLISLYTSFRNVMELLNCIVFTFLNQHYKQQFQINFCIKSPIFISYLLNFLIHFLQKCYGTLELYCV